MRLEPLGQKLFDNCVFSVKLGKCYRCRFRQDAVLLKRSSILVGAVVTKKTAERVENYMSAIIMARESPSTYSFVISSQPRVEQ